MLPQSGCVPAVPAAAVAQAWRPNACHTCRPGLPCLQAHEQLAAAQDAAHEMQEALKGARERAEAGDLSMASLKAQLAEAKKEADARERALQVGIVCAAGCC